MKCRRTVPSGYGSVLAAALVILLPWSLATGQQTGQSAAALVEALADQSSLQIDSLTTLGGSCHALEDFARERRRIAAALVSLGAPAIPYIDEAIGSTERRGPNSEPSPGTNWLLYAYAKIRGPAALPRLHALAGNSNLAHFENVIDESISLALGLTSYVDSSRQQSIAVCRTQEPRDTLDHFILAWEQDDRKRLETSLGPRSMSWLDPLLRAKGWKGVRADFWHHLRGGVLAVGYRFHAPGRWSQPEETLDPGMSFGTTERIYGDPSLETSFTSGTGGDCGSVTIEFRAPKGQTGFAEKYQIDNGDLGALLHLVDSCAAQIGVPH